jgi:hypothetical protein
MLYVDDDFRPAGPQPGPLSAGEPYCVLTGDTVRDLRDMARRMIDSGTWALHFRTAGMTDRQTGHKFYRPSYLVPVGRSNYFVESRQVQRVRAGAEPWRNVKPAVQVEDLGKSPHPEDTPAPAETPIPSVPS